MLREQLPGDSSSQHLEHHPILVVPYHMAWMIIVDVSRFLRPTNNMAGRCW